MHAQVGDWLLVQGRDIDHHARRGQILSVDSADGAPPYRVRWADDGHEAIVVPGPDTTVVSQAELSKLDAVKAGPLTSRPPGAAGIRSAD